MRCRYCGESDNFGRSHIIPNAFFQDMMGDADFLRQYQEGGYPRRLRKGVYDEGILCQECERMFGDWDGYAVAYLRGYIECAEQVVSGGRLIGYQSGDCDYSLLKLFFISMLWRASVSREDFYGAVSLGPYEEIAKRMIGEDNPGGVDDFSVIVSLVDFRHGVVSFNPVKVRVNQILFYKFFIYKYEVFIKVDRRPLPYFFRPFVLNNTGNFIAFAKSFETSAEFPLIYRLIHG